ncbi:hypothetical protein QN277_018829 [Acacia crassicarpa]|uniref:Uncharacterized protein n=1 Tax=Acacia crassicarpa TaxID=499986 RepID=A0AAE1KI94_9FABA|nr:hypothetical protein QN277_018829 [Acacia crassicarpa]
MGSSALLLLKLALLAAYYTPTAVPAAVPPANCAKKCGSVDIPYPFGTMKGCFKDPDFQINCTRSSNGHSIPYLAKKSYDVHDIEVLKISEDTSEISVSMPVSILSYHPKNRDSEGYAMFDIFQMPSKFGISNKKNRFFVLGCDTYAFLYDQEGKRLNGCNVLCFDDRSSSGTSNNETCDSDFQLTVANYSIRIIGYGINPSVTKKRYSYAFVAQIGSFNNSDPKDRKKIRETNTSKVVLDWAVDSTNSCGGACKSNNSGCVPSESVSGQYFCNCTQGFRGNPYSYRVDGCKDVDECHDDSNLNKCLHPNSCRNTDGDYKCSCPSGQKGNGRDQTVVGGSGCSPIITIPLVVTIALLGVFTLVFILCWAHKRRTLKQLRQRNFEQNGGNLLLQQLSQEQRYTDKTRIFTEVELKNATNNFDETRILGRGGQGTVYKGTLSDNTLVAVKKSRVGGDPQHIKSFINEVFVLSQINHRHVVKLLGCCLETEVPLLVYEFVDNGSLLDHLDPSENECSITWDTRLRIATETAGAISYLHSSASIPIIHRDIKSANILLDHNNTTKVSDFGASRLVHLDEAQVATVIQGTIGYLDPEYLQTGLLNEKSDVYSFGIVLVELLTGNKAFQFNTLANYFVSSMKEDRLWEILDKRVLDQKKNAMILNEVASLAKRCIRVSGEERPTMKEVAMELEGLMAKGKHLHEKDKDMMEKESEYLLGYCPNNDGYGSTSASFSVTSGHDSIQKHVAFDIIDGGR